MSALEEALRRVARDLQAAGQRWALIGGLAASARAEPRTTRDIDLAVALLDQHASVRASTTIQTICPLPPLDLPA